MCHNPPHPKDVLTWRKLAGTGFQLNLMQPSKKLIRSQKPMEGSCNYYVWCTEDTFQEDVYQTTYLVSRRIPRVSMKHTQDIIQATLLAKVHWRLEQKWSIQCKNRNVINGRSRLIWLKTVARHGRLSGRYPTTQPLQTTTPPPCLVSCSSMAEEQYKQSQSVLYYQLMKGSLLWCQHSVKNNS